MFVVVVISIIVVEYDRRGHHRLSLIRRVCSCRSCLSLVGSPERRKIFLLLLSRLLSITHTRTLDDAEIKIDSRQSVPSPS